MLATLYKPKGSGHLYNAYAKLLNLTFESSGGNVEDYITEFQQAVEEIDEFSGQVSLLKDQKLLNFLFLRHSGPFDEERTQHWTLSDCVSSVRNRARSPTNSDAQAYINVPKRSENLTSRNKPGSTPADFITALVSFCRHCKKPRHFESECEQMLITKHQLRWCL